MNYINVCLDNHISNKHIQMDLTIGENASILRPSFNTDVFLIENDVLQRAICMVWEVFLVVHVLKCLSEKLFSFFRSLLWCFMYMAKLAGQVLLCGSTYVLRYIGDEESSN